MARKRAQKEATSPPPAAETEAVGKRLEAEQAFIDVQRRACELAGREMGAALQQIERKYKVRLVVLQTYRNGQPMAPALQFEPAPLNEQ